MMNQRGDTEMVVPDLTAQPRQGYSRGNQGVVQILRKSQKLLVDEGFGALTLRRIAAECGMTQGNLSYYFKSKSDLVMALIDAIASSYRSACENLELEADGKPGAELRRLVEIYLGDIATRRTTRIFTELWAMASREEQVRARLKEIYDSAVDMFAAVVGRTRPELDDEARRGIALAVVAILEGQTVFIGHDMPFADQREMLVGVVCETIVAMVLRWEG